MMDNSQFLGFNFKPLEIQDQNILEPFLKSHPKILSGYTFPSLFSWNRLYSYSWTLLNDETLIISTWIAFQNERHLLEPIGTFSKKTKVTLLNQIQKHSSPIKIYGVSDLFIEQHEDFTNHFMNHNERNEANYLYSSKNLLELKGTHYEKKRNLIAQAEKAYSWNVVSLKEANHLYDKELIQIALKWNESQKNEELDNEFKALEIAIQNHRELKIEGLIILINNKPLAFSMYYPMNETTVDIYFEKADRTYKGLYQIINRETAKRVHQQGYTWINREEDLGHEGLRKAKLSYFPDKILNSHQLTFID